MATIDDLAAALNNHQVTDENGEITDEGTFVSESAADEASTAETYEDESTGVEKPTESIEEDTQFSEEDEGTEHVEDESGKRYIPANRFNKVYGELKARERELESLKRPQQQAPQATSTGETPLGTGLNPVAALEVEMLMEKYPQFDRNSSEYSRTLDEMGAEIFNNNVVDGKPTITRLEAARRAITRARELTQTTVAKKAEVKALKRATADTGLASRASRGSDAPINIDDMSLEEKEAYLKRTGNW